jgi:hypothetical protein
MTQKDHPFATLSALQGARLARVRYEQLQSDEGPAPWSLLPSFDSVDLAVELNTDGGRTALVCREFDERTRDYGLRAEAGPIAAQDLSAPVDVTDVSRWRELKGSGISRIEEARWRRDGPEPPEYPPALAIHFEGGRTTVLAAADALAGSLVAGADGVTVFFSAQAAADAGIDVRPAPGRAT